MSCHPHRLHSTTDPWACQIGVLITSGRLPLSENQDILPLYSEVWVLFGVYSTEEGKVPDPFDAGFARQIVLRPTLLDQPYFYPFYQFKSAGLAKVGPLLAELDDLLVTDESLCDKNRHAARREDLVALEEDGAGG